MRGGANSKLSPLNDKGEIIKLFSFVTFFSSISSPEKKTQNKDEHFWQILREKVDGILGG